MTAWWYWALFAVAAILILAVPLCWWLEDRAEERDQEAWNRLHRPVGIIESAEQDEDGIRIEGRWL